MEKREGSKPLMRIGTMGHEKHGKTTLLMAILTVLGYDPEQVSHIAELFPHGVSHGCFKD
ncbi:MAG: hypothetical protein ACXABY_00675 [Candidatus Thorarchaeota archaeon]|jgi:translation elongation factor EF-Tu-like GTPase